MAAHIGGDHKFKESKYLLMILKRRKQIRSIYKINIALIGNSSIYFILDRLEVFGGDDLKECYNFDMGTVNSVDDISKYSFHIARY